MNMSMEAINSATSTAASLTNVGASSAPVNAPSTASVSSSTSGSSTSSASPLAPTDQVTLSAQGTRAAQFIQEARATFTQSSTLVNAAQLQQLKDDVDNGQYPPQALTEGMLSLIGSSLISAAESNDSGS